MNYREMIKKAATPHYAPHFVPLLQEIPEKAYLPLPGNLVRLYDNKDGFFEVDIHFAGDAYTVEGYADVATRALPFQVYWGNLTHVYGPSGTDLIKHLSDAHKIHLADLIWKELEQ